MRIDHRFEITLTLSPAVLERVDRVLTLVECLASGQPEQLAAQLKASADRLNLAVSQSSSQEK